MFIFDFAFELPYFQLNFTITDNLVTAVIMITISFVTCTLTTKLKKQEAVRAESEKEKMRADLLRAISHDLRTPLTTIYGASSALLENDRELSPPAKEKNAGKYQGGCGLAYKNGRKSSFHYPA